MKERLFCLGNALYDISAPCETTLLKKYKLKPDESVEAAAEHNELFLNLFNNHAAVHSPGGSAQNTAKVAQWVLNKFGNGKVTFVGCIGNDLYGQKLQEYMKDSHVDAIYDIHKTASTGVSAALITKDHKRTLCARLGAASLFQPDFLQSSEVKSHLKDSKIIYVEGFFLSHNPQCILQLAELAERTAKVFALNLSSVFICENHFSSLKPCVFLADMIFGNSEEFTAFANKCELRYSSIEECAAAVSLLPCEKRQKRVTLITQGPDPVIMAIGESVYEYPVPSIKSIGDTIGCGDAFVSGFLSAVFYDKHVDTAVNWGIYCATEIAKNRGCTLPSFQPDI